MNNWSQILLKLLLKKGIHVNVTWSDQTETQKQNSIVRKKFIHDLLEAIIK